MTTPAVLYVPHGPHGGPMRVLVASAPVRALVAPLIDNLEEHPTHGVHGRALGFLEGYCGRFGITVRSGYRHLSALAGEYLELHTADQLVTYAGSHLALTHPALYFGEEVSDAA